MISKERTIGEFLFSTNKSLIDIDYVHRFIANDSYWAKGIPKETVELSIQHSLCFGVYHTNKQVGFARLITDYATFAYLADVFIDETYRGKGLSKQLMNFIFEIEALKTFRRIMLRTKDAHSLYEKFGFKGLSDASPVMEIHHQNVYG